MVNHIDSYVGATRTAKDDCWGRVMRQLSKRCICVMGTYYGNYMSYVYLMMKLVYVLNCTGQLFLLSLFLGTDYHMFGVHVVLSLIRGEDWASSLRLVTNYMYS